MFIFTCSTFFRCFKSCQIQFSVGGSPTALWARTQWLSGLCLPRDALSQHQDTGPWFTPLALQYPSERDCSSTKLFLQIASSSLTCVSSYFPWVPLHFYWLTIPTLHKFPLGRCSLSYKSGLVPQTFSGSNLTVLNCTSGKHSVSFP